MDAKESRAETALIERGSDGGAKFTPQYDRSKCPDAGASVFKGDTAGSRPCAVIGPDRVVPPARDCPKKAPVEPWLTPDPVYRRLPDYPHNMSDHKDPSRNISPRQTFQENMQRIIMPPGYNAIKLHEDPYTSKNNKLNVPLDAKYCDVSLPYNINAISSDQKHIRNPDHSASNVNPLLMRGVPQGWPAGSVNVRPLRPYGAPEVLQYPDYANCNGPRPVLTRTHTSGHEELQQMYPDTYYHDGNVRFKPYPNIKERYPQSRYEYLGNYSNPYHPPHPYTHKYEIPKTMPPHTYTGYPPVPLKYAERMPEPLMEGYQRAFSQQGNYGVPIRNPVIHPPYRPVPGNHIQNNLHLYPPDNQHKPPVPNKLPYDPTSKMYLDYDSRMKTLPVSDSYYLNELPRSYQVKNSIVLPNYASANMHGVTHPYYIKENMSLKNYEYARLKNMDPAMLNHSLTKLPPQFSPSTLAISPADSNASNETVQTHGTAQEDCGYASQSSVTSVRSIESLNRMPMDPYGRYDYRYGPVVRTSPSSKPDLNSHPGSKSKKDIRQFISSWSEGDDENAENNAKKDVIKSITEDKRPYNKQYEAVSNQEQLYVLGLVNVPSEELSKYEHIQKVSKLPENIKGYNSLELLNQFEEAIESSNIVSAKPPTPRAVQMPLNIMTHKHDPIPRAVSPLDVEAKISQSVIHKEVGCNFEIKPCSPKMLNVEMATPMHTLMNERAIEKVANPVSVKSPMVLQNVDENIGSTLINKSIKYPAPNPAPSCKMINNHHLSESSAVDHLKTNYSLQDLESSSGVCLASLPRLDTDIELNFPEVNQQFINANKAGSVITSSTAKDLPTLDVDQSDSNVMKNVMAVPEYDMSYQFSPKIENETDFSRLSKYRKLKRRVPDDNGLELAKAQATRVNSVIIKNPENTKSLEENNDTVMSGGYFRNASQEFAMNLVSQAKTQKANHHELDKTLVASFSTNSYDATGNSSRTDVVTHKSGLALNKSLNIIEDITSNNVFHDQSEDLSMHGKDISNRYLEKAALELPMNLSPQAKYAMVGVDEDVRNSASDKVATQPNVTLDVKHQSGVEATCSKNAQEEQNNISIVNLNKTDDPTSVSNKQYHEEPNLKPNISNTNFIKQLDDDEICKDKHTELNINEVHSSAVNASCNDQDRKMNEMHDRNLEKFVGTSMTREIIHDKDIDDQIVSQTNQPENKCNNNINLKYPEQERDTLYVNGRRKDYKIPHQNKIKRKKQRADVTNRKPNTERKSVSKVNSKKIIRKERNLKILNYEKRRDKSTNVKPMPISVNVVPIENNNLEDSTFKETCSDEVDNKSTSINSESAYNAVTKYINENIGNATESIETKPSPEIIMDDSSCLPVTDKCFTELSKLEKEATSSDVITPQSNKQHEVIVTADVSSDSSLIPNKNPAMDTLSTILLFDQKYLEEKSIRSNAVTQCNEKESGTPVSVYQDENKIEERQYNSNVSCVNNKLEAQKILDENQTNLMGICDKFDFTLSKSDDALQCVTTVSKEEISTVYSECDLNYDYYQNDLNKNNFARNICKFQTHISKELFSPRFQNLLIYDEIPGVGDRRTDSYKFNELPITQIVPCEPVIQNPEICATGDTSAVMNTTHSVNESTDDKDTFEKLESGLSQDTEINVDKVNMPEEESENTLNTKLSASAELSLAVINTTQSINESTDYNDTFEKFKSGWSQDTAIEVDKASMPEESSGNNPNKKMSACAEYTDIANNLNNLDSDFYEEPNTEKYNHGATTATSEIEDTSYVTSPDIIDDRQLSDSERQVTDIDILHKPVNTTIAKPFCNEADLDKEIENNCGDKEIELGPAENIESTCGSNIIVIEETNMTQEQANEYRKYDNSVMNTYELDKKIKSSQYWSDRPRFSLKRSLSDSALNAYDDKFSESSEKRCFMLPKKRKKLTDIGNINESQLLNIIQSSRRNSVSALTNENFSLCILIDDNCIVAEENYEQENDFIQLADDTSNEGFKNYTVEHDKSASVIYNAEDQSQNNCETCLTKCDEEKTWIDDVGCEETIETEDIAENIVIGEPASPKDTELSDYESDEEEMGMLNKDAVNHTSKVKHIYGDNLCTNDAQLVDALYRTPQMDVNKKLMDRESHTAEKVHKYYDSDSLEMLLAEPVDNIPVVFTASDIECNKYATAQRANKNTLNEDTTRFEVMAPLVSDFNHTKVTVAIDQDIGTVKNSKATNDGDALDFTVHSCESSLDNVFSYIHKGESSYSCSSSPEVSSTTSEEKNSSILLKISSCKGSRISEIKSVTYERQNENGCKLTEKEYLNPNYNNVMPTKRPLLTKAAQKYIPPIRESIPDLKVKLALPQQSLMKLQKNKVTKEEPKLSTRNMYSSTNNIKEKKYIPRKVKPKFEDVLKNIDEVQFQMHKEKNKKPKKYIPKVVIKKSENGSHYASTSRKESFNPDLTGRKWQPWVFIEKNLFIDKMALRNKTRAVFNHRRKSYVLAEKFCKYKSISSTKFIISQPKINDFSTGNLKYTIKLKHTY